MLVKSSGIGRIVVLALASAALTMPAHAGLSISKAMTENVSCQGGRCVATAAQAVLNVKDVENLLATKHKVEIRAAIAKDITVDAPLTWTSSAALSFSARGSLLVNKPVTVAGHAAVNIQSKGIVFARKASLTFWDTTSALTINGNAYTLVGDLLRLSLDLEVHEHGFYALAKDCEESHSDHYFDVLNFYGFFDGLGHTVSNLQIDDNGMIEVNEGSVRNFNLLNAQFVGGGRTSNGFLAGLNYGTIDHVSVTGTATNAYETGGLAGENFGTISNSNARAKIASSWYMGGLVARNFGTISASYAEGVIETYQTDLRGVVGYGGLVGTNEENGKVENSYSSVRLRSMRATAMYGGLVGTSLDRSSIVNSYATGRIEKGRHSGAQPGGVTGYVGTASSNNESGFSNSYWDLDDGIGNPADGAGNIPNVPGITGLTDVQLKSGLPVGFDPKVWGQNPNINSGYPYLLNNPPN